MAAQSLKLTWLKPGQSIRDYIASRRAENAENCDKIEQSPHVAWAPAPQIGRKAAVKRSAQRSLQRRHVTISRMTPAPPDRYEREVRMPGWGSSRDYESDCEVLSLPPKRFREPESAPHFVDLRAVQPRRKVYEERPLAGPSRRRSVGRKEAQEVEELARRAGQVPQKKMAPVGRVAYKSIPKSFQTHLAAATQLRPEELSRHPQRKSVLLQRAYAPKSGARKKPAMSATMRSDGDVESVLSFSSDTEEFDELESSSSDVESLPLRNQARKTPSYRLPSVDVNAQELSRYRTQHIPDSSSEDENDELNLENAAAPLQAINLGPATELEERITTPTIEPEPIIQLFRTFQLHTLPTDILQEAKQLPFLTRNLRKSFLLLCHNLGIPTILLPHDQQGAILVRYEHVANASFERPVPKWFCPLCNLLGKLTTREVLTIHLKAYHRETYTEWVQPTDKEVHEGISWRLHILLPEIDENMIGRPHPSPAPAEIAEPGSEPEGPPITSDHALPTRIRVSTLPLTPAAQIDPSMLFHLDERAPVSPQWRSALPPIASPKVQEGKVPSAAQKFKPRPPQYPRPPPSSNRLGAAARPPYLPAKSTFGGPDIYYSTRFTGPCLFDLLNLLPLEPFGVFDGMVIDQEEEIYNDDELRQEEKVIVALWARWVMLNKTEFDKDKAGGVKNFIDEYWRMIHLAAGWEALVYQLLVLAAWRLLKHYEIIPLLEHYEDLVGMQHWDEWDSSEE